ncbi:MAG: HAD family hydrolase [Candidatus Palauibacterales bacterium]|nr:HAD family hydrolase [Candidatus Palauibacterales bacterium]
MTAAKLLPDVRMRRLLLLLSSTFFMSAACDQGVDRSPVTEAAAPTSDPLPSWNDGATKQSILTFVEKVTTPGSPDFVPAAERIATFDNDGTLWAERPLYSQLFFAIDRVKQLAPQHPEWNTQEPFASLLKGDTKAAFADGEKSAVEIVMATHAGMTTAEFENIVKDWVATARHPVTNRLYTEMVYQPMLELLAFLRANDFKTFIVSGGGIEFMRPWTERIYGIPPEQVVGSSIKTKFEMKDGGPVLVRLADIDFIDDKAGKPVGINSHIGRRPIAAFGNSDGDLQMLQWATAGEGARFALLVHHTDGEREFAYDTGAENALDASAQNGWTVVDMKSDWKVIYPPEGN